MNTSKPRTAEQAIDLFQYQFPDKAWSPELRQSLIGLGGTIIACWWTLAGKRAADNRSDQADEYMTIYGRNNHFLATALIVVGEMTDALCNEGYPEWVARFMANFTSKP